MISTQLPPCKLLAMSYAGTDLTIQFNKYARTYADVPQLLAYKLFYTKTGRNCMEVYSREIKGKFKVKQVK